MNPLYTPIGLPGFAASVRDEVARNLGPAAMDVQRLHAATTCGQRQFLDFGRWWMGSWSSSGSQDEEVSSGASVMPCEDRRPGTTADQGNLVEWPARLGACRAAR